MKNILLITLFLISLMSSNCTTPDFSAALLVNHIGYTTDGPKKVILQSDEAITKATFDLLDKHGDQVYTGSFAEGGAVDQWHTGNAYVGDFSAFDLEGDFYITASIKGREVKSHQFSIKDDLLVQQLVPILLEGLQGVRCEGVYDEKDKTMTFFGERNDTVDVHGGWYDASGEKGKYLSHLCFANYMTPQQTPMFVWNMLETISSLAGNVPVPPGLIANLVDEITFGADFLVRMQDPDGYFYTTIFANWSWEADQREISAYIGQHGEKNDQYQAGFREGGGMAIAALARASKDVQDGVYSKEDYLRTAERGFAHLTVYNTEYIDDGEENIIDDYCALMAAAELYYATEKADYLVYARGRAQNMIDRLTDDDNVKGWWRADADGKRPYFHGSEAGMPLVSMYRYAEIEPDQELKGKVMAAIQKSVDFELGITDQVYNPFGYARQYVKAVDEEFMKTSFFFPHNNESGYWWQGENARLASLASAMHVALPYLREDQQTRARNYAIDQVNWILGLNPYNACMVEGVGHNNPMYDEGSGQLNIRGGVANGITGGFEQERDIAFMPLPQNDDMNHKWRWGEQWTLHGLWLMLAVASME